MQGRISGRVIIVDHGWHHGHVLLLWFWFLYQSWFRWWKLYTAISECDFEYPEFLNLNISAMQFLQLSLHNKWGFLLRICSVNVTKSALWIWSHLLKKSLIQNFMFCAMYVFSYWQNQDTNDKRQNHFAWQSKITFLLGFFSVKYSTEYATE